MQAGSDYRTYLDEAAREAMRDWFSQRGHLRNDVGSSVLSAVEALPQAEVVATLPRSAP